MSREDQSRARLRRAVVLPVALGIAALATVFVPPSARGTNAGSFVTVTSSVKAWIWDPNRPSAAGHLADTARSVTVDQATDLVSQVVHVSWRDFSASGSPSAITPGQYPVRIYECDRALPTDPRQCFGDLGFNELHPGYGLVGSQTNQLQTFSSADGTGTADFPLLTGADNPALGCAPAHDCSLVVVPWAGGDANGKDDRGRPGFGDGSSPECDDHSLDLKVDRRTLRGNWAFPGFDTSQPTTNRGCDWAARIVVPLKFAPTPLNCPARDADFASEGAPMLRRAIDQWRSGVCNGAAGREPLQVGYSGLSEYQARSDFDRGAVDLALTSQPATGGTRKARYAPVAVGSIAVAYYVDDQITGRPITDLRLNARLLAKLLTQSYTAGLSSDCDNPGAYACAPEVAGNPPSIFSDPEFLALNPDYSRAHFPSISQGDASPNVVYGLSDATYEVTRWIAADPAAAAFLKGTPDSWGMHVNDAYLPTKAPKYPIPAFNANDTGHTKTVDDCGRVGGDPPFSCAIGGMQNSWFPINGLDNVARQLVSGKNTAKLYIPVCNGDFPPIRGVCTHYVSTPSEALGTRGLFAIVSNGDAAAYQFPTASLETKTGSGTFVPLTASTVGGAVAKMQTSPDGITQSLNYARLDDAAAYPLTMISYAMVPTCGLSAAKAAAMSTFLTYTSSAAGNTIGVHPGNLAAGYLPLPVSLRTQAASAAAAVAGGRSSCGAPHGSSTPPPGSASPTLAGQSSASSHSPSGNGFGAGSGGTGSGDSPTSPGASPTPSPSVSAVPIPSVQPAAFHSVTPDSAGPAALIVPIVLIAGAVLLITGPAVMVLSRTGVGGAARRLRILTGRT